MKSFDQKTDEELEEKVLCAMAEAIARGREFDVVCQKIIDIVNDMLNEDASVGLPADHPQVSH